MKIVNGELGKEKKTKARLEIYLVFEGVSNSRKK
jgi:hypothetical protein